MNSIANIWQHPKTSVAGLFIAVSTIAGVLSQQGVTLGHVGSGSVVSLAGGLAAALLGLLARDPESSVTKGSTARLGAWALILLMIPTPWWMGCSGQSVAQQIVNWTPALQAAVATVDSTGSLLDPADAPIFTAATVGFDAASNLLATQAKAYLANPSASTLVQLQNQVVVLEQQVNASLLAAAKIVNPSSQQQAINAINGVLAIVGAILALVESVSSASAKARMAAEARIKIAAIQPYFNRNLAAKIIAAHSSEPLEIATAEVIHFQSQAALYGL